MLDKPFHYIHCILILFILSISYMKIQAQPSPQFEAKWRTYTAAGAAAAAAGFVGNAQAAIAFLDLNDIVVIDVIDNDPTPTTFSVDFNGDGQAELNIGQNLNGATHWDAVFIPTGSATQLYGNLPGGFLYPSRLAAGQSIGAAAPFNPVPTGKFGGYLAWNNGYSNSKWAGTPGGPPATGFLGVRFRISGLDHYGWIRMSVEGNGPPTPNAITLHDLAYQTTPGVGIDAGAVPEPGGLGLLALGGLGVMSMRRRKGAAA